MPSGFLWVPGLLPPGPPLLDAQSPGPDSWFHSHTCASRLSPPQVVLQLRVPAPAEQPGGGPAVARLPAPHGPAAAPDAATGEPPPRAAPGKRPQCPEHRNTSCRFRVFFQVFLPTLSLFTIFYINCCVLLCRGWRTNPGKAPGITYHTLSRHGGPCRLVCACLGWSRLLTWPQTWPHCPLCPLQRRMQGRPAVAPL